MCTYIVNKLEQGMAVVSTSWIPQRPWIVACATAAGLYGRRIGVTYAPGLISDFFIRRTITFMGSETVGKITGLTIIAPMFTPDLIPFAVTASGFMMFYVVVLICNIAYKIFSHFQSKQSKPSPEVASA